MVFDKSGSLTDVSSHSRNRIIVVTVFLITCFTAPVGSVLSQTRTNAQEVLAKTLATYERAESYEDVGEMRLLRNVKSLLDETKSSTRSKTIVSFKIYFEKPNLFRFDWLNKSTNTSRDSTIWFDGQEHYIWALDRVTADDRFNLERKKGLDYLIDRAVKPSNGTILTIPGLLISTLRPYTFADVIKNLSEATIIKEQFVDGEMCYLISAKASNDPWVFWVGKRSFLLRKMRSILATGSFDEPSKARRSIRLIAEEVHRNIRVNPRIPEEIFHYKPKILGRDRDLTK